MRAAEARRWGWHHLTDHWAECVVADANIGRGELVVDIGAGTGAITAQLVAAGARVIAVELHHARAHELRRRFADARVTVVETDAADLRLPRRPFRVVANPPFASSVAILRRLLAPGSRMYAADLVLPRHLARRYASGPAPAAGRWRLVYDARVGRAVPARAFAPPATTPTATLVLRRHRARYR